MVVVVVGRLRAGRTWRAAAGGRSGVLEERLRELAGGVVHQPVVCLMQSVPFPGFRKFQGRHSSEVQTLEQEKKYSYE
jgi:hypothetical protein